MPKPTRVTRNQPQLRREMERRGITVSELARMADVPRTTLNSWLLDGCSPMAEHAVQVSLALGRAVTVEQLVRGANRERRAS